MAMIKCPECDRDISSLAKKCPACGCPINMGSQGLKDNSPKDIQLNETVLEKKKHSILSVWALVLTCFVVTYPIALVIAIIDLSKKDKTQNHIGSIVTYAICIIFIIAVAIGCLATLVN